MLFFSLTCTLSPADSPEEDELPNVNDGDRNAGRAMRGKRHNTYVNHQEALDHSYVGFPKRDFSPSQVYTFPT